MSDTVGNATGLPRAAGGGNCSWHAAARGRAGGPPVRHSPVGAPPWSRRPQARCVSRCIERGRRRVLEGLCRQACDRRLGSPKLRGSGAVVQTPPILELQPAKWRGPHTERPHLGPRNCRVGQASQYSKQLNPPSLTEIFDTHIFLAHKRCQRRPCCAASRSVADD